MEKLIDTHCHLNFDSFSNDLVDVLERADKAGVTRMIIPATDLDTSRSALRLSESRDGLFAAIGVHPNDAQIWQPGFVSDLETIAGSPKVKAVGEIGLDFYRQHATPQDQREAFVSQLKLAEKVNLPVIIHCRSAFQEIYPLVLNWVNGLIKSGNPLASLPGVFHSFEGNLEEAQMILDLGFMIGVTGPVTYTNALERQTTIGALPLDHLVVETDAPFLTPQPFRGKRNQPEYITYIIDKIALLKDLPYNTVAEATTKNASVLFR
ncbi:MAG TPA: TatD family hydrolase, partial [Longilinea sp.]|nr:TatD family hydrolase [Longilinea sp.]